MAQGYENAGTCLSVLNRIDDALELLDSAKKLFKGDVDKVKRLNGALVRVRMTQAGTLHSNGKLEFSSSVISISYFTFVVRVAEALAALKKVVKDAPADLAPKVHFNMAIMQVFASAVIASIILQSSDIQHGAVH